MLTLVNITKIYDRRRKRAALKNVSLSFPDKGLFLLSGPSGSGKTTLLTILGGMASQSSGEFYCLEEKITSKNYDRYRSQYVSFVFQFSNLIADYSIYDNLRVAYDLSGEKADKEKIVEALRKVNLPDGDDIEAFLKKRPNELSGGQIQRVAIARALVKKPRILILDEPTSSIDKENAASVAKILKEISKDALVIVATHDEETFSSIHDGIILLKRGEVVSSSIPEGEASPKQTAKIKPRLSFLEKMHFAFGMLSRRKWRFIFSLTSLILSFSVLSFALNCSTIDFVETSIASQANRGSQIAFLSAHDETQAEVPFSEGQLSALSGETYFPYDAFSLPIKEKYRAKADQDGSLTTAFMRKMNAIYLNGEKNPGALCLTPCGAYGDITKMHLPENDGEIALSDLTASYFLKNSEYLDVFGLNFVIEPSDLLGTMISFFDEEVWDAPIHKRIVGVFSTDDENLSFWDGS
ncbi:MAG: ATP-binding cassette domain-containing protein, partial [Bacilli bacterium]|nr:ATP-binding cassette domain-containing protein [Bacilli bacterium]